MTLLLPAEDALTLVSSFLAGFESKTRAKLAERLGPAEGLDFIRSGFTAAAGIVFMKPHAPFARAYELAESLCKYAKEKTERKSSALAWWRATGGIRPDFQEVIDEELTPGGDRVLTMMPYVIGEKVDARNNPTLSSLNALRAALRDSPRGSMRQLLGEMYQSKDLVERQFERICEVLDSTKKKGEDPARELREAFNAVSRAAAGNSPLWTGDHMPRTPLYDAITLNVIEPKGDEA